MESSIAKKCAWNYLLVKTVTAPDVKILVLLQSDEKKDDGDMTGECRKREKKKNERGNVF